MEFIVTKLNQTQTKVKQYSITNMKIKIMYFQHQRS